MGNYNRVILMGNLTRDPEVRFLDSGMAVASFGLAVNRKWKKDGETKEEVSFFDCEAWGKTAEICGEYLAKGRPVLIDGRLKQERWEDDGGNKRQKIKVVINEVQFLGSREQGEPAAEGPAGNAGASPGAGASAEEDAF